MCSYQVADYLTLHHVIKTCRKIAIYLAYYVLTRRSNMRWPSVVHRAHSGPNQSERRKDNRDIVFEGHVTH